MIKTLIYGSFYGVSIVFLFRQNMRKDTYISTLKEFGLSDNEAKVYISMLLLGPSSVLPISRDTGIRRTTVYTVIEALMNKGLITIETRGFKRLYQAADPRALSSIFESKKKNLESIIPELSTFHEVGGVESTIRTYEGLASVKRLYQDILHSFKAKDFCYAVSDTDKFIEKDPQFFTKYIEDRAKLGIDLKLIVRDSPSARERKKFARNYGAQIRLLPANTQVVATFTVTKDIFMTQTFEGRLLAFATNNKKFISLQKSLFEVMWNSLEE